MEKNLTRKIIAEHLTGQEMVPGQEFAISIDQTLTHDLQVLGWQQFEAMGFPGGRTDTLEQGDELEMAGIHAALLVGKNLAVKNLTRDTTFQLTYDFSNRQLEIMLAGGLLNYIKKGGA